MGHNFLKRLPKKVRRTVYGILAGVIMIAVLTFLILFFPSNIEVTGNSRYSEREIESMVMRGPFSWNTLLMSGLHGHINMEDVPFMQSVDVEYLNCNTLRIHVSEKYPVGYVEYEGSAYYFDKEGMVLESVDANTIAQQAIQDKIADLEAQEAAEGAAGDGTDQTQMDGTDQNQMDGTDQESPENADSATDGETSAEEENPEDAEMQAGSVAGTEAVASSSTGNVNDQFQPQLSDVSLITGLTFEPPVVDQKLIVSDDAVFEHLYGLARMINKYGIKPDSIELDETLQMTLHYGNARIALGKDQNLEEKMTRASAILPQITGMSGVLHLEDFTEDTQNIIFDKD